MRVPRLTALFLTAPYLAAAAAAQPDGVRVVFPSPRLAEASTAAPPSSPATAPPSATAPSPSAAPVTAPSPAIDANAVAPTRPVLYGIILGERGFIVYIEDPQTRQVSPLPRGRHRVRAHDRGDRGSERDVAGA